MRKILIFFGFVAVAIVLAFFMYKVFWSSTKTTSTKPGQDTTNNNQGFPQSNTGKGQIVTSTPNGELPGMQGQSTSTQNQNNNQGSETGRENKIENLEASTVTSITVGEGSQNLQYYNKNDGKFYTVDNNGKKRTLSDQQFYDVKNVTWSKNGDKAVITYPDDSKIIYDFNTNQQVSLAKHWDEFSFNQSGDQLVFKSIGSETDNRWLGVVNSDGTGARAIEKIGDNADTIDVSYSPNNQIIAMQIVGNDMNSKKIYFIGMNGENFPSLTVEGRGFMSQWSPSGQNLLYSTYSTDNNQKPSLWITTASGEDIGANQKSLEIETFANKCVFASEDQILCAVPQNMPDNAGMFPMLADSTKDDLYLINTKDGSRTVLDNTGNFNYKNLNFNKAEKTLYFTNNKDNSLRKLAIPGI